MKKVEYSVGTEEMLYEYMNWEAIEALTYSEEDHPERILGARKVKDGVLIQAFFPGEEELWIKIPETGEVCEMVCEDEHGFFAVLLSGKKIPRYHFLLADGREFADAYAFPCQITEKEEKRFQSGIWYDAAEKLGAHRTVIDGETGVLFAVWAPGAERVSVVGDFNDWDGRRCPMHRHESGIFELFIPGLGAGELYKYELKLRNGFTYVKADPYANATQKMPETASVTADLSYEWKDKNWMDIRMAKQADQAPIAIYEMHIGSWKKKEDGSCYNYRELAPELKKYLVQQGYTHVEFMPLMEYPDDASFGYGTSGFFAPTARYGRPQDLMYLIDTLHQAGIGVILDWVPAFFARGENGLSDFDGTCLYEDANPQRGIHPVWNQPVFCYGRPEVTCFLISSALFWLRKYHVDGLRLNDVASMLYLDYHRNTGEWTANLYGGNENLEAVEFLKHLNSIVAKTVPGALVVAEDNSGWPELTGSLNTGGLGFSEKWNDGWAKDFLAYMQLDPYFRGQHQEDLLLGFVYAYSEKYILSFSYDLAGRESFLKLMPGYREETKMANLRLAYAFMIAHPGKKLFFMGQDVGQREAWDPQGELDWGSCVGSPMEKFMADLLHLYTAQPALYRFDLDEKGFSWISNLDAERTMLVFLRQTEKKTDTLLVVCNFSNVLYHNVRVGVPYAGKYKEIFNSDAACYGGTDAVNPRVKISRRLEADERPDSIGVNVPPLGVSVFRYVEVKESATDNQAARKKQGGRRVKSALKAVEAEKNAENSLKNMAQEERKKQKKISVRESPKKNLSK